MLIKLSGEKHVNPEHIVLIEPYEYAQEGSMLRWTVEFSSGGIVRLTQGQCEELMTRVQVFDASFMEER